MNDVFSLVCVAAVGLWGWRQWKAIQQAQGKTIIPVNYVPPEGGDLISPPDTAKPLADSGKPQGAKKWLIVAACLLWIISPIDGDFIPFIGWLDDAFAAYIAYQQFKK
jgi:hypothetical protein